MKKYTFALALFFSLGFVQAQAIKSADFKLSSDGKRIRSIELSLGNGFVVGVNDRMEIAYLESENRNIPAGSIYDAGLNIKYYDQFDIHDPKGKIKSIGDVVFKYNNVFDVHEGFGTLKSVGDIEVKYYNVFDSNDPKGSIKSVGPVHISYYNNSDSAYHAGKIPLIEGNNDFVNVVILSNRERGRSR